MENRTSDTFQLVIETNERYSVRAQPRSSATPEIPYLPTGRLVYLGEGRAYRHNIVRRKAVNKNSGEVAFDQELIVNHAKVMYDPALIDPNLFRESSI